MKKLFLALASLLLITSAVAAQSTDLNTAISSSAKEISSKLPVKANVAVVNFFSDTNELSNYITSQMIKGISNAGLQKVLERDPKKMALVNAEMDYQYSGAVSDSSMVEIGYDLGANYLVYGTFDQLGGMLQFSVQATDVETKEIVYYQSYTILSNATVTKLLGDKMELVTLSDFLEAIARCDRKMSALEANKNGAVDSGVDVIMSKYAAEMQAVYQIKKEPWESTAEYDEQIKTKITALTKKRDGEIAAVKTAATPKYDQQIKSVEAQKQQILTDLKNTTFVLKGASVETFIGDFNAEAKPKNWPISVKSLDKNVAYMFSGKYVVNDADVKSEYKTVEDARKNKDLAGEIRYKVTQTMPNSSSFDVYIDSVRLSIASSGAVLVNETVRKVTGSIDANKIVDGGNTKKAPEKPNVVQKTTTPAKPSAPKPATPAKSVHPRTYELDPMDAGVTWDFVYNEYGLNYISTAERSHFRFVKDDKPKAGDTVIIKARFTSDMDINGLHFAIADTSESAGWWTELTDWTFMDSVKANQPVDINVTLKIKKDVKDEFRIVFNYGENVKTPTGKTASLRFARPTAVASTNNSNKRPAFYDISKVGVAKDTNCQGTVKESNITFEGTSYPSLIFNGKSAKTQKDGNFLSLTFYDSGAEVKKGNTIKFKIKGDGNEYNLRLTMNNGTKTENGTVYSKFFKTKKNQVIEVEIPYSKLTYEDWSKKASFDKNNILDFSIAPNFYYSGGYRSDTEYNFEIFDIRFFSK